LFAQVSEARHSPEALQVALAAALVTQVPVVRSQVE
jgi:hypothetical protein